MNLGWEIFQQTGSSTFFVSKLMTTGLPMEVIPVTRLVVWNMLTQEAWDALSSDLSLRNKSKATLVIPPEKEAMILVERYMKPRCTQKKSNQIWASGSLLNGV